MFHDMETLSRALSLREDVDRLGVGGSHESKTKVCAPYDTIVTNQELRNKTRLLYMDGHFTRAVEEAYKLIDNLVNDKAAAYCKTKSGTALMQQAMSPKDGVLRFGQGSAESQRDEQAGYMQIFAGCMMGIRNPRAHDSDYVDDEHTALCLLAFANHLIVKLENAKVVLPA